MIHTISSEDGREYRFYVREAKRDKKPLGRYFLNYRRVDPGRAACGHSIWLRLLRDADTDHFPTVREAVAKLKDTVEGAGN